MHQNIEFAPAKINLALHVTGQLESGYHKLESLVVFTQLADELQASEGAKDSLHIDGPFAATLTSGQTNLVQKAITAFRARWPDRVEHGVAVRLTKNLPIAAGIGGGSADAAAALRLMAGLSKIPITTEALLEIAADLGADVPVCLVSKPCLVSGIGEIARLLPDFPQFHIVLVNPLFPLLTAEVFKRLKQRENQPLPALGDALVHPTTTALWLADTRNDLQNPATEAAPVLAEINEAIAKTRGCLLARMSGSGATLFGLYGSSTDAHQAAHDVRALWPKFWVSAAPLNH